MRVLAVLLAVLVLAPGASARELWRDGKGSQADAAGWFVPPAGAGWLGLKVGLTLPADGYAVLEGPGSLEFYLPCRGWVEDIGIFVASGCQPEHGRDSLNGVCVITSEMGCDQQGGRVLLIVRLPEMFPTKDCRPTRMRWVSSKGSYHADDR